ncbi:hypothetical protein CCHL11_10065 [Colletotrichum chlorophyti]|uniref:Uncharacterized protein n=1 Tax=Colletotrichum chlorophyti TaxID=708187 RepID=A0A1Q8S5H5_9PEZI|nr:hypothetical protein CCHL11_10065 [Colletotrichum chlorophyti]
MAARLATDAVFRCIDQATVYVGLKSDVVGQSVNYYEFDRTYQPRGWPNLDLCEALKTAERPHSDLESPDNNLRCASKELLYLFGNIARRGLLYRDGGDVVFARYSLDTFAAFART